MKLKQLRKESNEESEKMQKFGEIFYLSGSMMCEGKTVRQAFASVAKQFPEYINFEYDARFFGLLSSSMEDMFTKMAEKGYIQQQYNVKKFHPVHHARKLTSDYRDHIQEKIEQGSLKKEMIEDMAAELLSVTAVPIKVSTAWGLYMAYVDSEKPSENYVTEKIDAEPFAIQGTIHKNTINKLEKQLTVDYNWIVDKLDVKKHSDSDYDFYFSIKKEGIKARYDYLTMTRDYLDTTRKRFERAKNNNKKSFDLLINNVKGEFPELEKDRVEHLKKLINIHGNGIAEKYVDYTLEKLDKIECDYDEITFSYTSILNNLLGALADASQQYSNRDEMLRVNISILPKIPFIRSAITTTKLYVPDAIRDEVKKESANKKWHSGLDLHTLHIPQILERLYIIENGYQNRVSSSLLYRKE